MLAPPAVPRAVCMFMYVCTPYCVRIPTLLPLSYVSRMLNAERGRNQAGITLTGGPSATGRGTGMLCNLYVRHERTGPELA